MSGSTAAKDRYLAQFERFSANGGAAAPDWVKQTRSQAIERFADLGFPTTRAEEWRFTNIKPIADEPYELTGGPRSIEANIADLSVVSTAVQRVVIADGHFSGEHSSICQLPDGVTVGSLSSALDSGNELVRRHLAQYARYSENAFTALCTAFLRDGAFIHVPKNAVVETPIEVLFVSSDADLTVTHPRCLVLVDSGAQVDVVENYVSPGSGKYFTNAVTELVVGENARVRYYRVQQESPSAHHVATTHVHQHRDSRLSLTLIAFGAALSRHDVRLVLDGEGAESSLNGLYVMSGKQHVDHHTVIEHARPHCTSVERLNGIMADFSRAVFVGRIVVRKGAQKTDAKQSNNNLLLSESARADSQPQLEIYADDVRCTHGATLGPLDERSMFYLRSRGIDEAGARRLLTYGFGAEILGWIPVGDVSERLHTLFKNRLENMIGT